MTLLEINILIGLHFVSDWVLQPRGMARQKSKSYPHLFGHAFIVFIVFLPYAYYFDKDPSIAFINALLHAIVDQSIWHIYTCAKWAVNEATPGEKLEYCGDYWFYFTIAVDQYIHLSIIFLLFF